MATSTTRKPPLNLEARYLDVNHALDRLTEVSAAFQTLCKANASFQAALEDMARASAEGRAIDWMSSRALSASLRQTTSRATASFFEALYDVEARLEADGEEEPGEETAAPPA